MSEEIKRWQPTPQQRAVLDGLLEEEAREKDRSSFVARFLPFGVSRWSQITVAMDPPRHNDKGELILSYFDKISETAAEKQMAELEELLDEIPRLRAEQSRVREIEILPTSKLRAVQTAVRECALKPGPERIVLVKAPTGGGKTMICNALQEKMSARVVEVRDVWRHSEKGFVPLVDICKAAGVRGVGRDNNIARMQDALVKFVSERKIVLCFDEGEHFGRAALNHLKFLLNKTRIVVVLLVVPTEYEKWFGWWPNEAGQIKRRIHACINASVVESRDAALFFPDNQFANAEEALKIICAEATAFGSFSFIKRLADKLAGETRVPHAVVSGADKKRHGSDLDKAIKAVRRQMEEGEEVES